MSARPRSARPLVVKREAMSLGGAAALLALGLFLAMVVGIVAPPAHGAEPKPRAVAAASVPGVEAVASVGLTVSNMDRSIAFYRDVLQFEKVSDVEVAGEDVERLQGVFALRMRVVTMNLGGESLVLTEYLAPRGKGRPEEARSNDRWFQHVAIIVSDMERAYRSLRAHDVEHVSPGPQRLPDWNPNAGGIEAFYFRDPDGHALEILKFPKGKGDPKWHQPTDRLFLGIDHTAIVVSDTERSLAFYRDVLGFQVAGASENYGPEQERLNSVFGARVRITALRAPNGGPGVEFLEYVSPGGGRPTPSDAQANDLMHWQTRLQVASVDAAVARLRRAGAAFVSPGGVALREPSLGILKGALVRDPDGHALELVEPVARHANAVSITRSAR